MAKKYLLISNIIICILLTTKLPVYGQSDKDSTHTNIDKNYLLNTVEVVGYIEPQEQPLTPNSVSLLSKREIELQSPVSMVSVMNTVPGVRMEERSPGSYRLSIRGSLVRSPYGVRNVKFYYNDFALTDGGGNTYLNVLNVNDMEGIEILKGPDGSLFGANSGGVVLLKSNINRQNATYLNLYGGSYGTAGNSFYLARNSGKHFWTIKQSFQRSDGYRHNSANHRFFLQLSDIWQYSENNSIEAYLFFSDLDYQTPGGLTKEQYDEDARQSRPATATMPGSADQKTRINTKMYFGGISHKAKLLPVLSHTFSVWYNHVDFVYPFITNYEIRKEDNQGIRTYFTLGKGKNNPGNLETSLSVGFEGQRMVMDTYNYENHAGIKGDILAYNDILSTQYFGFIRGRLAWKEKLVFESAVSLNYNSYHFRDTTRIKNKFPAIWMPHFAISYNIVEPLVIRFTVSRGFSPPTTAEIRPEDNKVHTHLYAEHGWNIEAGFRLNILNNRIICDVSSFHYLLEDGIISQTDSAGNTFFVNSGRIKQFGVESDISVILLPYSPENIFFKKIQWNCNYTYSHFLYDRYVTDDADYTGNYVAGVPSHVLINNLYFNFPAGIYFFIQYNYTGRIPLNDANSAYADSYHLVSARLGMHTTWKRYFPRHIYLSGDNLLNRKYSLGNDLNAFGGRYYNVAPAINFQIGMKWEF